jgi:AcrR family transcriptional regulator
MSKSNIAARRGRPADPQARAKRRSQILEAAHRCFARKGFHLTTAAEISAEAEISVAGLYQYFPSKDDLILALIELDLAESVGLIEVLMASENFLMVLKAYSSWLCRTNGSKPCRAFG